MTAGPRSMTSSLAGCSARARRAAISRHQHIGGRVLEVGVGTVISLPQYAAQPAYLRHRYFGRDVAQSNVPGSPDFRLKNFEGPRRLDSEKLEFPDIHSTSWMAPIMSDRGAKSGSGAGNEIRARCCGGGEIILLSRVSAGCGLRRSIDSGSSRGSARLGFRTDFAWSRYNPIGRPESHGWNWSSVARCRPSATSR